MQRFTTYAATLDFLYTQLPMYQRTGASAYKKDLTNTVKLCEAIGNPQHRLKTIHIAGTNGKGTVSHLIAFGLQRQGLKVGLYTSPHYKDFRERIKINGLLADKKFITKFVQKHYETIKEIQPSFFEITVAMAFAYFAEHQVDVAVIEVGLGGRLDSTNIITPVVSIITNISFDHMDMLGDTLEKIASEKAGIIKPNVPVLIGEKQRKVNTVFIQKAKETKSPISYAQKNVSLSAISAQLTKRKIALTLPDQVLHLHTTLIAPYHDANLVTAFAALYKLGDHFKIDFKKIVRNFINFSPEMNYIGRWQIISRSPLTICDSAHNEAGLKNAMTLLKKYNHDKIHFVLGFVKDKDLSKVLTLFPKASHYYWSKADIPRGLEADILKENGQRHGLIGQSFKSVRAAYKSAILCARKNEVIYIGGSIFVAAEVL
jgi:dihydrofolate synthase / folylpolyglutamate synthase